MEIACRVPSEAGAEAREANAAAGRAHATALVDGARDCRQPLLEVAGSRQDLCSRATG